AFHPGYAENRRFFVNYTRDVAGQLQSVIAGFTASSADPNFADASSENILFTVNQPFSNHKGGGLAFGKDGFLYIGLGDRARARPSATDRLSMSGGVRCCASLWILRPRPVSTTPSRQPIPSWAKMPGAKFGFTACAIRFGSLSTAPAGICGSAMWDKTPMKR